MTVSSFESSPTEAVLQEDVPVPSSPAVPVVVDGVVRTDEMPCEPNGFWVRIPTGQSVKVLQRNPRRKVVVFQNLSIFITGDASEFILLSKTKGQCDQFTGYLIPSGNALTRIEFPWPDEMYARGVNLNSAGGLLGAFTAATNDCLLTVATFDWSH